jgi:hypothetical protein
MTVHMATPNEIGGSLGDDEVKVLHVDGPFRGMLVVNKLNEPTLDQAIAVGQVITQGGAFPGRKWILEFTNITGGFVDNPPTAYPLDLEGHVSTRSYLRRNPSTGRLWINGVRQQDVVFRVNHPNMIWNFPLHFPAAGSYDVRVEFDTGDWAVGSIVMLPVAAP